MGPEQSINGNGGAAAATTTRTARRNIEPDQNSGLNSNLVTLIDFKKTLLEEQKKGEERIKDLNNTIESTKRRIDDERVQLEELRVKLKQTNEQKDTELTRYTEMKNNLIARINECDSYASRFICPPKPDDVSKKACEYCNYRKSCREDN